MKKSEIVIGNAYTTNVSGKRVRVVVTGTHINSSKRTQFKVRRCDNGRDLQPRSPAALHYTSQSQE